MEFKNGAQLAAQALIDQGVDVIYTLSGGHITPIYQHLENSSIRLFDTRHEQAAVWMAEAYGRFNRKPGVAMVTAGPGFTNALTPIASAKMANTPLVLISGCVGIEMMEKLDLQDMRQLPVIEPMVKKAFVCHKPERTAEFIDMAFREAISGRPGPVYLELPVDMLNAALPEGVVPKRNITRVESKPVDIAKAGQLVELLKQAEKPMIIAGSGSWYADAGEEITWLAENAGIPVFTAAMGRGVIPDTHPYCFEASIAIRPGAALFASMSTDLLIVLGNRFSLFYIFGDLFNPAAKKVQVDIEPEEIGRNQQIDLPIMSDVKALVNEVNNVVSQNGVAAELKAKFNPWFEELKVQEKAGKDQGKPDWEKEGAPIHPMRLAKEIDNFLSQEDDILVTDGGDTTTWIGMTRTTKKAGHYLDYGLFGCIGGGVPYAMAAKSLNPDKRVCLLTGDGSIGFNFMEFENAVRKNLPFVVVISNDQGWGMIRHSQEIRVGHAIPDGTWIGPVNYHEIVETLGGKGFYVEKPEDIRPALEEAFACGKVACVNVMTDTTTVSPGSVALANLGAYKA